MSLGVGQMQRTPSCAPPPASASSSDNSSEASSSSGSVSDQRQQKWDELTLSMQGQTGNSGTRWVLVVL